MKTRYFEATADFKISGCIVQRGAQLEVKIPKGSDVSISGSGTLVTLRVGKQGYLVLQRDLDPKMRYLKNKKPAR